MNKKLSSTKKFELFIFCIFPFLASAISLAINASPMTSTLIFLGIPCVYLSIVFRPFIVKSSLFSLILAIPFVFVVDYLGHFNNQWYITDTVFPVRILGLVAIEDLIWAFLLSYFMLMFYEYFFDSRRDHSLWPNHLKYLLAFFSALVVGLILIVNIAPHLLVIPYFYLKIGLAGILLPLVIEFIRKPKLIQRCFVVGVFFFIFALVYELTALHIGWLIFPGKDFVGWVSILNVSFPFEEFFFWILSTAMAAIAYYEFFDDDER